MWECHVLLEPVHVHVGNMVAHRHLIDTVTLSLKERKTSRGQFKSREGRKRKREKEAGEKVGGEKGRDRWRKEGGGEREEALPLNP